MTGRTKAGRNVGLNDRKGAGPSEGPGAGPSDGVGPRAGQKVGSQDPERPGCLCGLLQKPLDLRTEQTRGWTAPGELWRALRERKGTARSVCLSWDICPALPFDICTPGSQAFALRCKSTTCPSGILLTASRSWDFLDSMVTWANSL